MSRGLGDVYKRQGWLDSGEGPVPVVPVLGRVLAAVLFADVPVKVQMKVTYTEPGLKGDTATNTLKPATVESGATVRVPLFINEGETIEIDTRDGSYVGRVKA